LKRTQERARDPVELDPTIPTYIGGVVMKCLETNRDQRYSSALDIIHDLGQQTITSSRTALTAIAPAQTAAAPTASASAFQRYRLWIGLGAAVLILAIAAVVFRGRIFGPRKHATGGPTVSLLILPFRNVSHDASIDWMGKSLAELLNSRMPIRWCQANMSKWAIRFGSTAHWKT
jgi:eukaryotic-like serine/threonine-protein kinase